MKHLRRCYTAVLLGAALFCHAPVRAATAPPAAVILSAFKHSLQTMHVHWSPREKAAEAATARFLKGGNLLVAGSIPRFDIEWLGRAGGLMPVTVMKNPAQAKADDVVVYGALRGAETADAAVLQKVKQTGALVIVFGTPASEARLARNADFYLPDYLTAKIPMAKQVAASLDIAQLWAFTGDFVAACTRQGKMPTMWESVMVAGSRERNAKYRPLRVHNDMHIPAINPGDLGERYLHAIYDSVSGLQGELKTLERAGVVIRHTVRSGHTVFHANLGHFEPARLLPDNFPVPLVIVPWKNGAPQLQAKGQPGDAALIVWYTAMPTDLLQVARAKGVTSICMVASNPQAPLDTSLVDVFIDPQWRFGDAAVTVPGYDVKVLPPSGVLNSLIFYAVLAEATHK